MMVETRTRQDQLDDQIEAAASHLYTIVRPEGGLAWEELSPGQQRKYRDAIYDAVDRLSTPMEAVGEAAQKGGA
jgi:hypothetical protein